VAHAHVTDVPQSWESYERVSAALGTEPVDGLILHAAMYGPQAAYIAEQFPTRVRYAGCSLAYTLAGVFGGGIAPMMFATLLRAYGTTSAIVSYTMVALVITGCVLIFARRPA